MFLGKSQSENNWGLRLLRFYGLTLLVVISIAYLFYELSLAASPRPHEATQLTKAKFTILNEYRNTPPPVDDTWEEVTLPHRIDLSRHGDKYGYGWYVLEIDQKASTKSGAIYVPRAGMNIEIYLDGALEGYFGPIQGATAERNWNRPYLVSTGNDLKDQQTHQLAIQARSYPFYLSGLSPVWVGPVENLRNVWQARDFFQLSALSLTNALVLGAIVILIALLSFPATRRPYLIWLIFACVLWSIRNYSFLVNTTSLSQDLHGRFIQGSMLTFLSMLFWLALNYIKVPADSPVRKFWAAYTLTFPVLLLIQADWTMPVVFVYGVLACLGMGYLSVALFFYGQRKKSLSVHYFAVGMAALALLGMHDLLFLIGMLPFDWYLLGQHLGLYMFLTLVIFLTSDYASIIQQSRNFNEKLRERLANQQLELENKHRKLESAAKERVTLEERTRLMADMHDGTGAYLVAALHHVRNSDCKDNQLENMLEDCLRDLQLTVDSLEPVDEDLSVLVGSFRYRISPNLKRAGIKLNWRIDRNLHPAKNMDPRRSLHLLRILQEVFSNILKHSQASEIDFTLKNEESGILMRITDNGIGFDTETQKGGKGLGNLQNRAKQINARLNIQSVIGQGTTVELGLLELE